MTFRFFIDLGLFFHCLGAFSDFPGPRRPALARRKRHYPNHV
jgi:hypothetical protein